MEEYGKEWLKDLEAVDCKYFVIKAEDLFEALNNDMVMEFNDILYYYNEYREQQGRSVNKYFVLNRDEYPQFKTAQEFFDWVNNKVKTKWEYKIIKSPSRLSEEELNGYGEKGWELVEVTKDFYTKHLSPGSSITGYTFIYRFKRLKQ